MFERIAAHVQSWREQRKSAQLHSDTLDSYRRGEYPDHPTIGLGRAFMDGLLEPSVMCQHAWTQKALHEGPIYLEAWRKASAGLRVKSKRARYYPYLPKNALDVAMSAFRSDWKKGWGPEYEGDTRSPALRAVQWVHRRDPHWIGANLDAVFFGSSMSVWDTLLYHDHDTSAWVMNTWPERLVGHQFPWKDWLSDNAPWMYPILKNTYDMPAEQWLVLSKHLAKWSPLQGMEPETQLRQAVALMGWPNEEIMPHNSSDKGVLWRALTQGVPADIGDPIGAALACAWPDMHPDCIAIKRHFYPALGNFTLAYAASLPEEAAFSANDSRSSGARATVFLYDSPQAWVHAMLGTWAQTRAGLENPAMEMELPGNLLD